MNKSAGTVELKGLIEPLGITNVAEERDVAESPVVGFDLDDLEFPSIMIPFEAH